MFLPRTPSFGLALIYLLFPADLSKYMFISFFSRTSAIIFWIAMILYVKRKPILSGFVAATTMLAYESHIAQAMFIPLIVFIVSQFSVAQVTKEVRVPTKLARSGRLPAAGLAVMYISYVPFALYPARWPPTIILTRLSSVHLGASIGYVLIWAGFFQLVSIGSRRLGS